MKYIFFTFNGHALSVAQHLQEEGRDVLVGQVEEKRDIVSPKEKNDHIEAADDRERRLTVFRGILDIMPADKLVEKMRMITDPKEYFVFFDFNYLFKFADQVKSLGFYGNFPTEDDHLFELDRDMAKNFVKQHYPKLHIAEVKEFEKIKDGIKFMKSTKEMWVVKGRDESAKTFVPDNDDFILARDQVIGALETYSRQYEKAGYILERLIPSVVELTPEKIYYDGIPLATLLDIENKPLGSGNISIQTGCAADLIFPTAMTDRINKIAFPPIVDELARQHMGLFIWDASILVNRRGGKMYFGEFCSNRPGYNALFSELSMLESPAKYFENISQRLTPFTLGTVATSIRVFNLHRTKDDRRVLDGATIAYKKDIAKNVWLMDAKKSNGRIVTAGIDFNLAVLTGAGKSINEAVDNMYEANDKFSFIGSYYRSKHDFLSLDYPTSILSRLNYGLDRKLYQLPFDVRVGEIT